MNVRCGASFEISLRQLYLFSERAFVFVSRVYSRTEMLCFLAYRCLLLLAVVEIINNEFRRALEVMPFFGV